MGAHVMQAAPAAANEELEGDRLAQKACEMVEEAAAEIGLLGPDTERLVKVRRDLLTQTYI